MLLVLLFWFFLVFYKANFSGKNQLYKNVLNFEQTVVIRGICAIEILIGHLGIATGSKLLFPNRKAGILFVGVFFLLSGYGLSYGIENKTDYMKNFLYRHIKNIILPAYIVYFLSIILKLLTGWPVELKQIFSMHGFFINTNWYVWEIIFFYILFYFSYSFIKDKKISNYIIFICSIIFICIAHINKFANPWYGSTLCFALGIWYQQNQGKIKKLVHKSFIGGLLILEALSVATFFVWKGDILANILARNIASLVFCVLVILFLHKVKLNNKYSLFLGRCSYEIFLIHPIMIEFYSKLINNRVVFSFAVIITTIIIGYLMHLGLSKIKK